MLQSTRSLNSFIIYILYTNSIPILNGSLLKFTIVSAPKKPCSAQSVVTSSGTFIHWGWHTTQRDWRSSKHSYIFTMCGCSSLKVEPRTYEHRMNMMNHLIAEVSWVIILIGHKLNASHGQVLENASLGLPLQKVKYTGRELLVLPPSIYPYVYIYAYIYTLDIDIYIYWYINTHICLSNLIDLWCLSIWCNPSIPWLPTTEPPCPVIEKPTVRNKRRNMYS